MTGCHYCELIAASDGTYQSAEAEYDLMSMAPRCPRHWRFVCDCHREPGHFALRFWCPLGGRLLCPEAGKARRVPFAFQAWSYHWELQCSECDEVHPGLDRAAFAGLLPDLSSRLDSARELKREKPLRRPRLPLEGLTDADIEANWNQIPDAWAAGYDERGDDNRRYLSDPVLLEMLGDVAGRRVLDCGSGNGYLSRLLSRRGGRVTGVENAARFMEMAVGAEREDGLGITYHHGSISSMPYLAAGSFDLAVANYVLMDVLDYEAALAEVARVLRPGGQLVAAILHMTPDFSWISAVPDSPRSEDRVGWLDEDYFVRRAGYVAIAELQPMVGFHRPLKDYVRAAREVGLQLCDLDEPEVGEEGLRELGPWIVRHAQRFAVSYILKWTRRP